MVCLLCGLFHRAIAVTVVVADAVAVAVDIHILAS